MVLEPGTVAGLIPWLLTGWEVHDTWPPLRVVGVFLIVAGVGVLLHAFARFVVEGIGTPAPVAPTQHLVVGGLYRYVRNPMYLAVAATIVGQALTLGQPVLLAYAAVFAVVVYRVRPVVRGANPQRAVRRAVRGVPAGGARLVAAAPSLARLTRADRPPRARRGRASSLPGT